MPDKIVAASAADNAWVANQISECKFEDADPLKKVADSLQDFSLRTKERLEIGKLGQPNSKAEILELFEELSEMLENSQQCSINICSAGGMFAIVELMVIHEDVNVRKAACSAFNTLTGNNTKVQAFATKMGSVNLAV